MQKSILVFDIGKTNKKTLLFDEKLRIITQHEEKFPTIVDEDGVECDDIEKIEKWILSTVENLVSEGKYDIKAVNFSTYGATLVYLDKEMNRLTPVYNYLKEMPEGVTEELYEKSGGIDEFSRKTASPALGMLNSGLQALWLKKKKPEVFEKVEYVLHFPQYLCNLLTKKIYSEFTSIGCHTGMWDFDNMQYHPWLKECGIFVPPPVANGITEEISVGGKNVKIGIGIHDSSASLAPYILGSDNKFILISTGTWSINMNPFNYEPLTAGELSKDCLSYMSISQKPVKSSRLFMGHIHDVNLERLNKHFNPAKDLFKCIPYTPTWMKEGRVFFSNGMPENFIDETVDLGQFETFEQAYHQLMIDLTDVLIDSINLIIPGKDDIKNIYISGGFARNDIFKKYLATKYPEKKFYTSEVDNSSAVGAALVVYDCLELENKPELDLGLVEI